MRIILAILASITVLSPKAQTYLPASQPNYTPWLFAPDTHYIVDSSHTDHKWQLSKYAGLSAGYIFFGGGTSFLSAPVGLQLSRPLNKNLYAFGGVSAAPVFFNFSRFTDPAFNKSYPGNGFSNGYGLGYHARVEAGLMYINDARTFSISGSIGVDRGSYPVYPYNGNGVNTKRQ
ncbi:MAG: hypothetical protein P4L51_08520 [Puia sp.]|nr:hypothetical protein [Puia sp.]